MYSLWEEKVGTKIQKKKNMENLEGDRTIGYETNNTVQILVYDIPY